MTSISNCYCELLSRPGGSALRAAVPLTEAESEPGAWPPAIDRRGSRGPLCVQLYSKDSRAEQDAWKIIHSLYLSCLIQ